MTKPIKKINSMRIIPADGITPNAKHKHAIATKNTIIQPITLASPFEKFHFGKPSKQRTVYVTNGLQHNAAKQEHNT